MTTIGQEINILRAGPEVKQNFEDWFERHLRGTLFEELMVFYKISKAEVVELLIAIVNPLIARKLNKQKPYHH